MLELGQRASCTEKFKELHILTVPRLYILEMMMFGFKNLTSTKLIIKFAPQIQGKKSISFTISKIIVSAKGCLLFLNNDI
jgi:hypothetical protein